MRRVLIVGALLALTAVLAAAVAQTPIHDYCWDASPGATGYRLYWSSSPTVWVSGQRVETTALCVPDPSPIPVPHEIVYYVVTAFNAVGESETEHGQII